MPYESSVPIVFKEDCVGFFNDILVYCVHLQDHFQHLHQVFEVMVNNILLSKQSKCVLWVANVEYLGHFISAAWVFTDLKEILGVQKWHVPTTMKQLRGFVGLDGYDRKIIRIYGLISRSLTRLLRKDGFIWSTRAEQAFIALKTPLATAHVLALPNYSTPFW